MREIQELKAEYEEERRNNQTLTDRLANMCTNDDESPVKEKDETSGGERWVLVNNI